MMKLNGWLSLPGATWWRGPEGVRAGWRVGLYLAVLAVFTVLFVMLARLGIKALGVNMAALPVLSAGGLAFQECMVLGPLLCAMAAMGWLEGAGWARYGLDTRRLAGLLWGAGAGLLAIAVLMTGLFGGGLATAAPGGLKGAVWLDGLGWAVTCLLIGAAEESLFRGYLLQALARGVGFWPAAVLTSALFAAAHAPNHNELPFSLVTTATAGLLFCLSVRRTGALWWAIGFHAAWDYGESFIYGTMDSGYRLLGSFLFTTPHGPVLLSGGTSGPEGSVFSLLVLAAVAGLWVIARPKAGQNSPPSAAR